MTNYELMFIIDPALEEDKKNAAIDRVKQLISDNGELGETDVWGMRKLAYEINKKTDGFYVVQQFQAEGDFIKELDRRLKIFDSVIRHMVINKDAR